MDVFSHKKPTKSLVRVCKLLSRVGRWMRKAETCGPKINVSCCLEEVAPLPPVRPSPPIPIAVSSQKLLTIPPVSYHGDNEQSDLSPSSPLTPRGASYPPTPDYVKFPNEFQRQPSFSAFFPTELSPVIPCSDEPEVRDWAIDYADLEIGAKLQKNSTGDIFRGRWHGNVLIYKHREQRSTEEFLADVDSMSKIRHENVLLFLGASVDAPEKFSIVMQPPKQQQSLHQLLNSPRRLNKLPHNVKWSVAHQVAQAVSYLHAKNVCVGSKLHSGNVFLETKIKLSTCMDFGFGPSDMFSRSDHTAPNHLTSFLAPELLASVNVNDPMEEAAAKLKLLCNKATDSFAFGSLLYELFTEQKPFRNLPSTELIASLNAGDASAFGLDRPEIPSSIQRIISRCWDFVPENRPSFMEILQSLRRRSFLVSRHSSSQPDKLDMIAVSNSKSFNQICS